MNKQKITRSAIIVGCVAGILTLIILISTFTVYFVAESRYTTISHFEDIGVCSRLDEFKVSNDALVDKHIGDAEYIESYNYKLCYDKAEFMLYAYEFESNETAKRYYSQVEGKTVDGDIDYNGRSGLFSSELIVRYTNNVYRIETGNTLDYIKAKKCLNSVFTVKIRE